MKNVLLVVLLAILSLSMVIRAAPTPEASPSLGVSGAMAIKALHAAREQKRARATSTTPRPNCDPNASKRNGPSNNPPKGKGKGMFNNCFG